METQLLHASLEDYQPYVGQKLNPVVLFNGSEVKSAIRYTWFRIQRGNCSVHEKVKATLQCLECLKSKVGVANSYHCTSECFMKAWPNHRALHNTGAKETYISSTDQELCIPRKIFQHGEETWFVVGNRKSYTPSISDLGHLLKFECSLVNEDDVMMGNKISILTSTVRSLTPTFRRLVSVGETEFRTGPDSFSVLTYNIKATDALSTNRSSTYSWPNHGQKLASEVIGYSADFVCLQEVAEDLFKDSIEPELRKQGYQNILTEAGQDIGSSDRFETLYRTDRFDFVEMHKVTDTRVKTIYAAIATLQDRVSGQRLCLVNVHLTPGWEMEKVRHLLRALDDVLQSAINPIVICGSFSSTPESDIYKLLTQERSERNLPRCVSAYTAFSRAKDVSIPDLLLLKDRMNPSNGEPNFTRMEVESSTTEDYIFYSPDKLVLEALLEPVDEKILRSRITECSVGWDSCHVALGAAFRYQIKNSME